MFHNLNPDQEKRDKIIWDLDPQDIEYIGGQCHFASIKLDTLQQLIDNNFIELEEYQNNSPPVKDFLKFAQKYPFTRLSGYTIDKDREDYRVTLTGLYISLFEIEDMQDLDILELRIDFCTFAGSANEFTVDTQCMSAEWDY